MKKLNVLLLLILINFPWWVAGQSLGPCSTEETIDTEKAGDCTPNGATWIDKYRNPGHWIPNSNTPIKTILVNYVICQKSDGTGGWIDGPLFRQQVADMFDSINEIYSHSLPKGYSVPCEPTYTHVTDSRIRFKLNEIYFIKNDDLHIAIGGNQILDYLFTHYPDAKNAMNHIFNMPEDAVDGWGYYKVYQGSYSYVHTYGSMISNWHVVWADHIGHIAHEYGHSVGLRHQYDNLEITNTTHFDFLDDIYGNCPILGNPCTVPANCNPQSGYVCPMAVCYFSGVPNSSPLMSSSFDSRYISPKSEGRMHRSLSLFNSHFGSNVKPMHQYVEEKTSYAIPLTITADETWDFAIKMYQDIVVKPGKTLTITCEVRMPINGKIIVEPGGKLVVDGGKITTAHMQRWNGIELWGNTAVAQTPSGGYYPQASLILKNGAVIANANNAVTTWKPNDWSMTGGVIKASDAIFQNNRRAVEFRYYPNFSDVSAFTNCEFVIDGPLLGGGYCNSMVTAENIKGISFKGCTFKCTDNTLNNINTFPKGIYTENAHFSVTPHCNMTTPTIPCPLNNMVPNRFIGLHTGIEALNGTNNTFTIDSASFENCRYGVVSMLVNQFKIVRSNFILNPFFTSGAANGIIHTNCTGFTIENNHFTSSTANAHSFALTGITSNTTGSGFNEIYNNAYSNLRNANISTGTNWVFGTTTSPLGLKYKCNTMTNNLIDIQVTNGTIGQNQGTASGSTYAPAGNIFSTTGDPEGHFKNMGANLVYYVHHDQSLSPWIVSPINRTINNVTLTPWAGHGLTTTNRSQYCPSRLTWGEETGEDPERTFMSVKRTYTQEFDTYKVLSKNHTTTTKVQKEALEASLSELASG